MSGDGGLVMDGTPESSSARNVGFSSIADQHGEASSRVESRSSGKRSQGSHRGHREGERKKEDMTPPGSEGRRSHEGSPGEHEGRGHRIRKSGGFLLDSVFTNGSPPGQSDMSSKRKAHDSPLHVKKRRPASNRFSGESSMRSSPLSKELSFDGSADPESDQQRKTSRPQTMDPAQLVQMALNLSESRRRHVSNTLQVPLPAGRRVSSSNYGTVRAASSSSRRASRLREKSGRQSPSSDQSGGQAESASSMNFNQDHVLHTFSPATLARAEKVRKYFELAAEYRRLLEHLPPLKPNADAPGNYTFASKSSPGSAFPEITRVATNNDEKHDLGRPYNPIQSLRNRRVRIRERRPFTAPPDTWQDPDKVKQWIDDVEEATQNDDYRAFGDHIELPEYTEEDESLANVQPGGKGHRRTDTAGSVITRPENSWTIEPTELLADVYWTEKGDNKYYVESRFGNPIFTQLPRKSTDTPKISVEMHRDRNDMDADGTAGSETDEAPKHNRRRRLMLPLNRSTKSQSEKRKHRRILSRTSSESSDGSVASAKARRLREGRSSVDKDLAPLERHMQELIEKDARGELSAEEVMSPDHWDSKHTHLGRARPSIDHVQRDSIDRPNARASLEVPRHDHRRSRSADGRMGSVDKEISSASTLDSEPTTPVGYGSSPGLDFSPPYKKRGSESGGSKLPAFRSQSKERRGVDQRDFSEPAGTALSPIISADSNNRPRSSAESDRPRVFGRHRTNDSIDKSLQRNDTDSTYGSVKEGGGSTVGRFLKGRRDKIGGLVSASFRTRDRAETLGTYDATKGASEVSDIDETRPVNGQLKKRMTEPPSSTEISPRGSFERGRPKPKFYLSGLPSFTTARNKQAQDDTANDHISRQQQEQRESGRSERFDKLAPPKINVADASPSEADSAPTRIKWAKGYGDLDSRGNSVSRSPSAVPSSGPGSTMRQRNRHWSIYDQVQPSLQTDKPTSRDIARVRALLLASGIKAREIQRRADLPRDEAPSYLRSAADISGEDIGDLPAMKDEHALASRLLSNYLTTSFQRLEQTIATFQSETAKSLADATGTLHSKASDQLTTLVHETSDEADAFTVELTTRGPQNTKQVLDAVDEMVRRRRRQWRLLVNVAFKVLEWVLLGIMWGIWAVVVVFNGVKRGLGGVGRVGRWLVTF